MISHTALCAVGSVILDQTFKRESCSELECILKYGCFGKAYVLVPTLSEFIKDLPLFVVQQLFQVLTVPCYVRKINLGNWNYFCTFTYHGEEQERGSGIRRTDPRILQGGLGS